VVRTPRRRRTVRQRVFLAPTEVAPLLRAAQRMAERRPARGAAGRDAARDLAAQSERGERSRGRAGERRCMRGTASIPECVCRSSEGVKRARSVATQPSPGESMGKCPSSTLPWSLSPRGLCVRRQPDLDGKWGEGRAPSAESARRRAGERPVGGQPPGRHTEARTHAMVRMIATPLFLASQSSPR